MDHLDEIVDVDELALGCAVPPDLDSAPIGRLGDLARDRRRRFLATAAPGALRAVAVLEAGDADLHVIASAIRQRYTLGVQLLPAVLVVRLSRVSLVLDHRWLAMGHVAVDADRGREEVARDAR